MFCYVYQFLLNSFCSYLNLTGLFVHTRKCIIASVILNILMYFPGTGQMLVNMDYNLLATRLKPVIIVKTM